MLAHSKRWSILFVWNWEYPQPAIHIQRHSQYMGQEEEAGIPRWCGASYQVSSLTATMNCLIWQHSIAIWMVDIDAYFHGRHQCNHRTSWWRNRSANTPAPDKHIMDQILESKKFTAAQIRRRWNYCRLFLQAITVSDCTDTSGTTLDLNKLAENPSIQSSTTTWLHVNQDQRSQEKWMLWRRANKLWSTENR